MSDFTRGVFWASMAVAVFFVGFVVGQASIQSHVASVAVRFYPQEGCVVFSDVHGGVTPCFKDGSRFLFYDNSILDAR